MEITLNTLVVSQQDDSMIMCNPLFHFLMLAPFFFSKKEEKKFKEDFHSLLTPVKLETRRAHHLLYAQTHIMFVN